LISSEAFIGALFQPGAAGDKQKDQQLNFN
jgi:hypothetical protein